MHVKINPLKHGTTLENHPKVHQSQTTFATGAHNGQTASPSPDQGQYKSSQQDNDPDDNQTPPPDRQTTDPDTVIVPVGGLSSHVFSVI
jgi:hypothetical protein